MTTLSKQHLKRPFLKAFLHVGRLLGSAFDRRVSLESVNTVLVVQFGGLGDVLRIFPVIETLRHHLPNAQIVVLSNQGSALFELLPPEYQDCEHWQLRLDWGYFKKLKSVRALRRRGFDLVVNPTRGDGMVEMCLLAFLVGARHRVGFDQDNAGFLHTAKLQFDPHKSIVVQNLELLKMIGLRAVRSTISLHV